MVHRRMTNDSKVADQLYIQRVLLVSEDFLFFSHYSLCCIAKQVTTSKQLQLMSCPDILDMNFEGLAMITILHYCYQYHLPPTTPITLERVHYNIPDTECTVSIV
jgi:hypothetical protein